MREVEVMSAKWTVFKEKLPHQQLPFNKRNWGNGLHSICSYQGKMKPSLAFHLVDVFTEPGDVVVDPFSGSGSIPFEAALNGRYAYGLDLSLLSTTVSNAKLNSIDDAAVEVMILKLQTWLQNCSPSDEDIQMAASFGFNGPIASYFHPDTLLEVLSARNFFMQDYQRTNEWYFVFACLLHILHGNRPYALSRNSHPITPFAPTGPFQYKSLIAKLREKVNRSLRLKQESNLIPGTCFQEDILAEWPSEIADVDAIITSPPFFDSTRFYMTNWMRFWLAGWSASDFETQTEQYIEKKQKRSLSVYTGIFHRFQQRLKPGGYVVLHLGESKKCDMAKELGSIAIEFFNIVDTFTESVEHCESHGVRDKGTVTGHQYLILQKS